MSYPDSEDWERNKEIHNKLVAKATIKPKWTMPQCWACGHRFRVYPEDLDKFGRRPDACPGCQHHIEIVEKLQGANMPGELYIFRRLAERIESMERSVGRLWEQIGCYEGRHGR